MGRSKKFRIGIWFSCALFIACLIPFLSFADEAPESYDQISEQWVEINLGAQVGLKKAVSLVSSSGGAQSVHKIQYHDGTDWVDALSGLTVGSGVSDTVDLGTATTSKIRFIAKTNLPTPKVWYSSAAFGSGATYSLGEDNSGLHEITFELIARGQGLDAVIMWGNSSSAASTFGDHSMLLRMSANNSFEVWNTGTNGYSSSQNLTYLANTSYQVKVLADLTEQVYDVYITPERGSPIHVASQFTFRGSVPMEDIGLVTLKSITTGQFEVINHQITEGTIAPTPTPVPTPTPTPTPPPLNPNPLTYEVGPERTYTSLLDLEAILKPGDTVLVDGDTTYTDRVNFYQSKGTEAQPITIRGIKINDQRPILQAVQGHGVRNFMVALHDNYIFEGFEVIGFDTTDNEVRRAIYHTGNNVVIRDNVIHNTYNGIHSSDADSGNLLMEYNELYNNGYLLAGAGHQIYVSSDQINFPGSVMRAQFNYIHDNTGGTGIATRAERAEIYYNYIEGTTSHAISLAGPDREAYGSYGRPPVPANIREDGDVVGNVIVNTNDSAVFINMGGDSNSTTNGRYRIVNNTFVNQAPGNYNSALKYNNALESIQFDNNVVTGTLYLENRNSAGWTNGRQFSGTNNWIDGKMVESTTNDKWPTELTNTIRSASPGFNNEYVGDFRLLENSVLIDAGTNTPTAPLGFEVPNAQLLPAYEPPNGAKLDPGQAVSRTIEGSTIDVGAFEYSEIPPVAPQTYLVGPGREYTTLNEVSYLLNPGDTVLVDGDASYTDRVTFVRPATAELPITIRGVKVNDNRPVLQGIAGPISPDYIVGFPSDYYVFEGFEVVGVSQTAANPTSGIAHLADHLIIRDNVIRNLKSGLTSSDTTSGSLVMEFNEIGFTSSHAISAASDQLDHADSIFRFQFNYIHDTGTLIAGILTRAERNEIYYNWITGTMQNGVILAGPNPSFYGTGDRAAMPNIREDSDLVGNVFSLANSGSKASFINVGDTNSINGRVRLVNNTFYHATMNYKAMLLLSGELESLEYYNNVFMSPQTSGTNLERLNTGFAWADSTRRVIGSNNWVKSGVSSVPVEWTDTVAGTDPGFTDAVNGNFRPASGSALIDEGVGTTTPFTGYEFPNPLPLPLYEPTGEHVGIGQEQARVITGSAIDIGALEYE